MPQNDARLNATEDGEAPTTALRVVVALMLTGAAWLLAGLLVPFFLALILAIALSPLANRLTKAGVPKGLVSALLVLAVAGVLAVTAGLILVQAGTILQDSNRYVSRISRLLTTVARRTGGDRIITSLDQLGSDDPAPAAGRKQKPGNRDEGRAQQSDQQGGGEDGSDDEAGFFDLLLRRGMEAIGTWLLAGLGGLIGGVGGLVLFLSYLFYMLQTRGEWIERITESLALLGLRPGPERLAKVQGEIVTYIGCLSLVALGYSILVGLILWAIGVPQPLLWGALAGLLEFVPYFGPLIASILPTIVALSLGTWWQPLAVLAQFVLLHLIDGYVITPLLYGRAIRLNPVTILFGAIFFGWIWGPLGLALSLPMIILLRGLLLMTPDTPALDAFAGVESRKEAADVAATARE